MNGSLSFPLCEDIKERCLTGARSTHQSTEHTGFHVTLYVIEKDAVAIRGFDGICQISPGEDALIANKFIIKVAIRVRSRFGWSLLRRRRLLVHGWLK